MKLARNLLATLAFGSVLAVTLQAHAGEAEIRKNLAAPGPFEPNQPTPVNFRLNDIAHTFRTGHKIMIQVQM